MAGRTLWTRLLSPLQRAILGALMALTVAILDRRLRATLKRRSPTSA
jgi:hypothetical protein